MITNLENINVESGPGGRQTALQFAASIGNLECVKMLVESSALDDPRNKRVGRTPLELAIGNNQSDVVKYLKKYRIVGI